MHFRTRRMAILAALGLLGWGLEPIPVAKAAPPQGKAESAREDLARDRPAMASTFQSDDKAPGSAFDGDPETRWCASDASAPQWLQVDLGRVEALTGYHLIWELGEIVHPHKVEGSLDGKTWSMLVDRAADREKSQERRAPFPPDARARLVRLTVLETDPDHWASLSTFEVFGTRPASSAKGPGQRPDDKTILRGIKGPDAFEVTAFAAPPDVRYPTCLAASPTGEVFVGMDENGSLDAKPDRGRVVRCIDVDGDGKADKFNVFASMDSPRGVVWDAGTLYVLHPPNLSAFVDTDGDGVADRSEVLVKGIGFDLKFRGADHTTNGIRLGIDGFLYIAVGDYGFVKAEGKDGRPLQLLGGGIARVRTDGTALEIVSRGQRNIYDVAIDPYLNLFTRDNTNDGDGWDVRLSHVVPTGHYGYPSLFKRFPDEHLPPLADYGGGSPCGSLYLQDSSLPKPFGDTLYTCEWGRGGVFRHPLETLGAGFRAKQEMFLEIPRPTDMDVDGLGRIYVSSWRDGGFNYSRPDIGYVVRLAAKGSKPARFPDLKLAKDLQLVESIAGNSAVLRLASQRELLRRGVTADSATALAVFASRGDVSLAGRAASTFTLGLRGDLGLVIQSLSRLAEQQPEVREFAIKAMSDHGKLASSLGADLFARFLDDPNPRVRLQAVVALGRSGQLEKSAAILPLTADRDPLVAHVAVKALVALDAAEACLKALGDPKLAAGASMALRAMHEPKVVAGLIRVVEGSRDLAARRPAFQALCRLYFAEAPYEGKWWGTRPDTSGPYYNAVTWGESEPIGQALRSAVRSADESTSRALLAEMLRNKVDFEDTTALALKLSSTDPALKVAATDLLISRPKLSLDAIKFLEAVATSDPDPASRAKATRGLIRHSSQQEARESSLRALGAISEQDEPAVDLVGTWLDFAKDGRHARDPGTYVKLAEGAEPGKAVLGYGVLIQVEGNSKASEGSKLDARRAIDRAWETPEAAPRILRAVALSKAMAYAPKVRSSLLDARPEIKRAAEFAARRLDIAGTTEAPPAKPKGVKPIAVTPYDTVLAAVLEDKGDATLGSVLFEKQGCVNCHAVAKGQPIKGPYLGDIASRYNRTELTEAILKPSAKIAQGFETKKFAMTSGQVYEGFVVREAGDEVEMRNSSGAVSVLAKKDIEETSKSELSVMPQGLLDPLTPHDLASVLAYLESLKGK